MDITVLDQFFTTTPLSLEDKIRRAIRALRFEQRDEKLWLRVAPNVPEGAATTLSAEMFMMARDMILAEMRKIMPTEETAQRATADHLLKS